MHKPKIELLTTNNTIWKNIMFLPVFKTANHADKSIEIVL